MSRLTSFFLLTSLLTLGVMSAVVSPLQADEEAGRRPVVVLGYGVVEGFIEEGGSGPGFEVMREVARRMEADGYVVVIMQDPFRRLLAGFMAGRLDLIFPIVNDGGFVRGGYAKWGFDKMPLYSSPLYHGGKFHIYTRIGEPTLDSVPELRGKRVGIMAGAFVPSALKPPTDYEVDQEITTGEQGFRMLQAKRIDAFLVQSRWGNSMLAAMPPQDDIHHGAPFGTILGGFISHQDEKGARLMARINHHIGRMLVDGAYAAILARHPDNELLIGYPAAPPCP